MGQPNDKLPFRVGLTGGIASGKTTVANLFGALGVPIVDTDVIAREVVAPGSEALSLIEDRFGKAVISEDGSLDRAATRKLVFADSDARNDLEAILHPRIGSEVIRQADAAEGPYQIIVVPLLVNSPLRQFLNRILVVDCSEETQVARLLQRDSESIEQARKILAAQSSREQRLAIADDIVLNDADLSELRAQVAELHQRYLHYARVPGPHAL